MFGAEIKVKRYIQALTCGKKTMAQINEPLTPFEKDLLLGITRHWICLNHALDQYLQKPTQHLDFRLTLIIGIYRLVLTTNPNNKAIIDGIMLLADQWKLAHRKKVIYAILNNILRNPPDFSSFPESTRYSLPLFFYNKMKEELGVYFEASAKSQTQRPQTWAYLFEVNHMSDQMIAPLEEYPQAVQFKDLKNLTEKEGYKAGHWQIQDLAMQKMMSFLPSKIDGIIIDACAAPGGKTIALHKKFPNNPIIAVEIEIAVNNNNNDNNNDLHVTMHSYYVVVVVNNNDNNNDNNNNDNNNNNNNDNDDNNNDHNNKNNNHNNNDNDHDNNNDHDNTHDNNNDHDNKHNNSENDHGNDSGHDNKRNKNDDSC